MYFGHHGEQNQWQKLEKVKNAQSYNETEEHKDGVKQMVFSYKKFLHSAQVYQNWLNHGNYQLTCTVFLFISCNIMRSYALLK